MAICAATDSAVAAQMAMATALAAPAQQAYSGTAMDADEMAAQQAEQQAGMESTGVRMSTADEPSPMAYSAAQTELAEAAAKLAGSQGQHGGHRHLGKRYKGVPVKNFQKQTALANIGVAALVASESAASHAHHHKAKVHAVAPLPDASMLNAASGTPTMQQVMSMRPSDFDWTNARGAAKAEADAKAGLAAETEIAQRAATKAAADAMQQRQAELTLAGRLAGIRASDRKASSLIADQQNARINAKVLADTRAEGVAMLARTQPKQQQQQQQAEVALPQWAAGTTAQGDAPEEGDAPADMDGFAGQTEESGGQAVDQSRFANLASASQQHSAQSDAAELGLSSPSQQQGRGAMPDRISADNLYGNEDDDANLRAMDDEDLGLTSKSDVHRAALQFGAKASLLMQKRPTHAPPVARAPVALAAAADEEVNTQESGASLAPKDDFATTGHFMLIPGTSCKSLSPTVTDAFCLSSCASGKAGSCPPTLCKCVNNAIPPPPELMGLPALGEDAAAAFLGSEGAAAAPPAADAASTSTSALVADTSEQESPSAQGSTALGAVNGTIVTVNASEMAAMLRRATTLVSAPVEPTMSTNHSSGSGMAVGDAFYTKVAVLSQSELFHTRTGVTISVPPGLTCVALQATVTPAWCLSTCAVTTTWIPECPGKCKCEDKGLPPPPGCGSTRASAPTRAATPSRSTTCASTSSTSPS